MGLEVWVPLDVDGAPAEVKQRSESHLEEMTSEQSRGIQGCFNADPPFCTPESDADFPRLVGQMTFSSRKLPGVQLGTCYDMVSEYFYYFSFIQRYWPRRFIESELWLLKVCYAEQNMGEFIYKYSLVCSIMWPFCTSFLKYILTFTKNDYQFSWHTSSLEIHHFKSNQLLVSSFFQKALLTFNISVFFLLFNSQIWKYADL